MLKSFINFFGLSPSPSKSKPMGIDKFSMLPQELIYFILCFLDVEDAFHLKVVSQSFNTVLKPWFNNDAVDYNYWKKRAEMTLAAKQIEKVYDYKELILNRLNLQDRLKTALEKDPITTSYARTIYIIRKFLKPYQLGTKRFSLQDIHDPLLQDEASILLNRVSIFGKLEVSMPKFSEDVKKIFRKHQNQRRQSMMVLSFSFPSLNIIGLLPIIMKVRAVKCF